MDLRSLTLGAPKAAPTAVPITLGGVDGTIYFRAPTVRDMANAEKQTDNARKMASLLIALTVDEGGKPVYTAADMEGILDLEATVFQKLSEAVAKVLDPKKPAPSSTGTDAAPSSSGS